MRCAQGHNISMQFIKEADRQPISSMQAEDIQAFARTIWTDLYARGLAPKTWGNASRKVHDKYEREMETWWPVLRYCSNHWKTHHIATKNYSQWYGRHETNETEAKAPAKKKCRTTIGDDNTGVTRPTRTWRLTQCPARLQTRIATSPYPLRKVPTRDLWQDLQGPRPGH